MWPVGIEFGREEVDYEDLEEGDLLIGIRGSRLWSPTTVYRVDHLLKNHTSHFEISELCWTDSDLSPPISRRYYSPKAGVGEGLHRLVRVQDLTLKKLFANVSVSCLHITDELKQLLVELEI